MYHSKALAVLAHQGVAMLDLQNRRFKVETMLGLCKQAKTLGK
jgi:sigma54-dependent transcription regulator